MSTKTANSSEIFLIDDSPLNCLIISKQLICINAHVKVNTFNSGLKALKALNTSESCLPQLILLDLEMPQMDGWEFLEALQKYNFALPVIIITSSLSNFHQERAQSYPLVKDYMTKPLNWHDIRKIHQCLC